MTLKNNNNTDCADLILTAFADMVASISKTITPTMLPHLYHSSATIHETNSVYHFAKSVENKSEHTAVYFEFPCDSGRVDAVILTESCLLLIEAKSSLSTNKLKVLERQAGRLENPNDSLRYRLSDKIPSFRQHCWGITKPCAIWGVILLETFDDQGLNIWRGLHNSQTNIYPVLSSFKFHDQLNPTYATQPWHHLLAFKRFTAII